MSPPLVTIYTTSLTSAPTVRKHHDLLRSSLKGWEIKYVEHDLVMEEDAKRRWQRAKPTGKVIGLPGYLVGGEWIGTMDDFEDAVETQSLVQFLKQDLDIPDEPAPASGAAPGTAPKQKSIQEVELEKLMGEMTNDDLDKLMQDLDVGEDAGTMGLRHQVQAEAKKSEEAKPEKEEEKLERRPEEEEKPLEAKKGETEEKETNRLAIESTRKADPKQVSSGKSGYSLEGIIVDAITGKETAGLSVKPAEEHEEDDKEDPAPLTTKDVESVGTTRGEGRRTVVDEIKEANELEDKEEADITVAKSKSE
ncbi:hypothetical protein L198_03636 [Cryptococcus wingfieldii CBS 7118]|uniref:Uncharacterized protein n=1 Tax=Cryptococcus wingfieldii CBS 7118 TaxID=1295528 RepID=A0A1E3JC24_9TREE|nr:hypothetical protein L198_03636 [Cryptococcus wingfieldii CBS 7118]ODN98392.1 hypothetical protein L198_03636 [Cryptococcus wingfieldii CBS 7118]